MRKITKDIVNSFLRCEAKSIDNSFTDGTTLFLHGNAIAKFDEEGNVWVKYGDWPSRTTFERLNGIPGVKVYTKKKIHYLNDKPWNGDWRKVDV